jgi:hypothetical protein
VGGKERVLHTSHSAAFDAKNRHGLPEKLPFAIDALAPVFGAQRTETPAKAEENPVPLEDRIFDTFRHKVDMANLVDFLVARGQLHYTSEGPLESINNLDPAYAGRMLADPARFIAAVNAWAKDKEVAS